jgi:hypothetical protein
VAETPPSVAPLLSALRALLDWIDAEGVPGVVIGGVAASLLGRPRTTADVDVLVLVEEGRWASLLAAGTRHGIRPRIDDALEFAAGSRVLLLRHEPTGLDLDVSLGLLPFEEQVVRTAERTAVADLSVPLPTPENLVVMKAVAGRPRDLVDIEGLFEVHPDLDVESVRRQVAEFSRILELPEMLDALDDLLRRR